MDIRADQEGLDYRFEAIEEKWQKRWESEAPKAEDFSKLPKRYLLVEFPYPSGDGLHVGHVRSYAAFDALARYHRLKGENVLYPMGWDAFGLPTENYALKTGIHPRAATDANIANFRRQMKALGLSFDWSREVDTTDPKYYRWTQWIFLRLLKKGLAYQATMPINWCPKDKIGLANEEVVNGKCERCGSEVTRKMQKQWMLKITAYAERLLKDLDTVDYLPKIKTQQVNWIGRSEGAEIQFRIQNAELKSEKLRFVLLHGFTGSAQTNFFPWLKHELEAQGHEVFAPELPNSANPTEEEQVDFVLKHAAIDENTVILGHSLGTIVAMKVVEKSKTPVAGLVLAGGFLEPKFTDKPRPFVSTFTWNFDFDDIRKKVGFIRVLSASNDSAVPLEAGRQLAEALGVSQEVVTAQENHFCGNEEPLLLEAVFPSITVFTTRPDTIFGATYLVLAPEHELVAKYKLQATNSKEVEKYVKQAAKKSDLDRTDLAKEKTGVELKGIKAINPANNEEIPIWVADYVLSTYGTGAIMAVPAHDERDHEFAKKYELPIRRVVEPKFVAGPESDSAVKVGQEFVKRNAVCAVIRNPKNDTYLCISWKTVRMQGLVTGGLEEGEDPIEAAKREIREETGYRNVKLVRDPEFAIHSLFYHRVKKQNRWARFTYLFFELENEERDLVEAKEAALHDVVWKNKDEMKDFFSVIEGQYLFKLLKDPKHIHTGEGVLYNSGGYDWVDSQDAAKAIVAELAKRGVGKFAVQYKLRDWVFSRQHYWGEPIPVVHCDKCGVVPVPEEQLPIELPHVEKYQPTDTGESPLANVTDWVNTTCPNCGGKAKRETDTMPNWAGSSWYFLRYCDPHNDREFADMKKLKYWLPVNLYNGGMEHTVLHLLYSRFWHKFLFDEGLVPTSEPYAHRHSHGIVLAEDNQKMSKSRGNVINPDDYIREYGADSLRMYEMFMGPFEDMIPWSSRGIVGVNRFLMRVHQVYSALAREKAGLKDVLHSVEIHRTIKKVGEDLESLKFNTAVSELMRCFNDRDFAPKVNQHGEPEGQDVDLEALKHFLVALFPFAPHLASELWERMFGGEISKEAWPTYEPGKLIADTITLVLQVNGKIRASILVPAGLEEAEAVKLARAEANVAKYLASEPKKVIYVKGKLINFVV
jgi:leucyl-tRNA synthetase